MPPAPNPPLDSDDSSEDESDQEEQATGWKTYYRPPTIHEAEAALQKIDQAVRTPRPSGGYLYAKLDRVTNERYSAIKACLNQFLMASPKGKRFIEASKDAARVQGRKETYAQTIRKWTRHFIQTGCLPSNHQGWWNVSILKDEDISGKIKLHLQQIGKLACAQDVVKFLRDPQVRDRLGITKRSPKGQYFDGHERKDVVTYRQQTYIPFIKALERRRTIYNQDGIPDPTRPMRLFPGEKPVIIWFHDESIFYANDRRTVRWVYIGEHPTPFKKGEGCSIMIADFVCAELGWLRGRNGSESARVAMYPGADKDGYFTNERVVLQLRDAIKIVQEHFPQFTHVFVYDNAPCHTKYSTSSLCAQGMPKGPLMDWPYYKDAENNRVFVPMEDGRLPDGSLQSFYDPENPRRFKGMAWILKERGLAHISEKNAQCTNFKCPEGRPTAAVVAPWSTNPTSSHVTHVYKRQLANSGLK
ncbi:hypothetical protein RHS01_06737 [Rhizoctonia solani]|uniref:Uncharacterized protein n=1 Tax=Rhizoctonia solani TaxID=456999 RepID=A0A8H7IAR2_9AGAM|nr:hypothetical protein RHS01_06737 [Rhizoctonia solani]